MNVRVDNSVVLVTAFKVVTNDETKLCGSNRASGERILGGYSTFSPRDLEYLLHLFHFFPLSVFHMSIIFQWIELQHSTL